MNAIVKGHVSRWNERGPDEFKHLPAIDKVADVLSGGEMVLCVVVKCLWTAGE